MTSHIRKHLPKIFLLAFIVLMSLGLYFYPPDRVVELVGARNVYLVMFILAFLGGLSTFTGIPYHWVLMAFAVGGANPYFLGISTGVGVILGDTTSYFVGYGGSELVPERFKHWIAKLFEFGTRHPRWLPVVIFLYGALMPSSNDVIVIPAGLVKYPFWKVMLPLALGNLVFNTWLALVAVGGYDLIQNLNLTLPK
jgi:membrane protein YqaA with SNARE-associated domain